MDKRIKRELLKLQKQAAKVYREIGIEWFILNAHEGEVFVRIPYDTFSENYVAANKQYIGSGTDYIAYDEDVKIVAHKSGYEYTGDAIREIVDSIKDLAECEWHLPLSIKWLMFDAWKNQLDVITNATGIELHEDDIEAIERTAAELEYIN